MSLRQLLLGLLNRLFQWRGMELRALTPPRADSSMAAGLARAATWAPRVRTVVDVGAAAGKWTRLAQPHFPSARLLLLEPLRERLGDLQALTAEFPLAEFSSSAAGKQPGTVSFHIAEDLDGSGVCPPGAPRARSVPVTTIDAEVAQRGLPPPYFLKLDTHGFELPILQGAAETLRATELLMIEAYNFTLAPGSLRFHELCAWLGGRGFRPSDGLDPLRRTSDGVLWQIDLVFLRAEHPVFTRTSF